MTGLVTADEELPCLVERVGELPRCARGDLDAAVHPHTSTAGVGHGLLLGHLGSLVADDGLVDLAPGVVEPKGDRLTPRHGETVRREADIPHLDLHNATRGRDRGAGRVAHRTTRVVDLGAGTAGEAHREEQGRDEEGTSRHRSPFAR